MKRSLYIILILIPLAAFQIACDGPGGGGGGGTGNTNETGGTNDNNTAAASFTVSEISVPATVQAEEQTTLSADITGKESEIILYQFLSNNGQSHMAPYSGIIATNDRAGQLKLQYKAPKNVGDYYYYLKVLNSDGEEIIKEFSVKVVE